MEWRVDYFENSIAQKQHFETRDAALDFAVSVVRAHADGYVIEIGGYDDESLVSHETWVGDAYS